MGRGAKPSVRTSTAQRRRNGNADGEIIRAYARGLRSVILCKASRGRCGAPSRSETDDFPRDPDDVRQNDFPQR